MKSLKYAEILSLNRELGTLLKGKKYLIVLLSNIVVNQLKEVLELELRQQGINAEVITGDYNNIVQNSSRFTEANAVIIFWESTDLVEGLNTRIMSMNVEEISALAERFEIEINLVLKNLEHAPLVLFNRFSSMVFSKDVLREGPLSLLCKRLNTALEKRVLSNQLIVDINAILAKVGIGEAVDFRQFQSSKALYTINFYKAYAKAVAPGFRAATGNSKKVLVLDCDNTLWSGIIGEDNENGIQMDDSSRKGKIFREVQQILYSVRQEGVLLALCSKNNAADVDKVLALHPDMILKDDDFVAKKVNWQDKATNLCELATELNIGLDSFVFVDDSPFELGLIAKKLPMVKCVQVPKNISEYPAVMLELKQEFFTLSHSVEDDRKTELYRQERQRKDEAGQFDSIDKYLASLELRLKILWDEDIPIPRSAQMTQKTNQFNLTTRRYTDADIQRMLSDPDYTLAVFSLEDRYGAYGVTGMIIIKLERASLRRALIDSFLMSCRVIGRNAEYAFFDQIIHKLRYRNFTELRAEYLETSKNSQVARFYDNLGFKLIAAGENRREYLITLSEYKPKNINYISINSDGN